MFLNLPATKFYGIGPKKSLDQTIDFINENRTLANRINSVNSRAEDAKCGGQGASARRSFKMSGSLHQGYKDKVAQTTTTNNIRLAKILMNAKSSIDR